jgi:hypothetical protein
MDNPINFFDDYLFSRDTIFCVWRDGVIQRTDTGKFYTSKEIDFLKIYKDLNHLNCDCVLGKEQCNWSNLLFIYLPSMEGPDVIINRKYIEMVDNHFHKGTRIHMQFPSKVHSLDIYTSYTLQQVHYLWKSGKLPPKEITQFCVNSIEVKLPVNDVYKMYKLPDDCPAKVKEALSQQSLPIEIQNLEYRSDNSNIMFDYCGIMHDNHVWQIRGVHHLYLEDCTHHFRIYSDYLDKVYRFMFNDRDIGRYKIQLKEEDFDVILFVDKKNLED